jgi:hypothetical protein
MPILKQIRKDRRDKKSCFLLESARDVASQFGEDGILERVFGTIGDRSRWCVEFGAWDGKRFSNTFNLIHNAGWSGVLIEASPTKFEKLRRTYTGIDRAVCIQGLVQPAAGPGSLDDVLSRTATPLEFDLLSVDIDGNDFHVWESLAVYRPRVVVIEFNPCVPNDVIFVQDRDLSINQGCSLRALIELGKTKGYELACVTAMNGIFVVEEDYLKLGIADNDIDAMAFSKRDGKYFDGFDGTLFHVGSPKLHWIKGVRIEPQQLQVLEPARRKYGHAVETGTESRTAEEPGGEA